MKTANDFARSLSLLRREKGVSQRTAAKDLGISQALLSHYENGVREPGLAFVRRACDYYHVSADFLLGRSMSREGVTIGVEELYDDSMRRDSVLQGSILAILDRKLLVNSIGILFDLLGKIGDKKSIQAASSLLSAMIYKIFRYLYRSTGTLDEGFFSIPTSHFLRGYMSAETICCEADFVSALDEHIRKNGKDSIPLMSNDALTRDYPGMYQSLLQLLHSTAHRVNYNTKGRWSGSENQSSGG